MFLNDCFVKDEIFYRRFFMSQEKIDKYEVK